MKKFLIATLALVGMTQADHGMNGFDPHTGHHVVHESHIDPIDVAPYRTVPEYRRGDGGYDGHRSSDHHDHIHGRIYPQDVLEHPLGGHKYESVHQAVKEDKGVWHDDHHGHDGWDDHHDEHGHEHGHDGYEHGLDGWHGHEGHGHGHDEHGHDDHEHGHDLHANDFFDGIHGFHGHDWHDDDHHDGGDHHNGHDFRGYH